MVLFCPLNSGHFQRTQEYPCGPILGSQESSSSDLRPLIRAPTAVVVVGVVCPLSIIRTSRPRQVWFPREIQKTLQKPSRGPPGHPQPKPSKNPPKRVPEGGFPPFWWAAEGRPPFLEGFWRVWVEGVREGPGRVFGGFLGFPWETRPAGAGTL